MSENRFDFRYTINDVASAQRMRFLRSNQIKIIFILWLGMLLFVIASMMLPDLIPFTVSMSWGLVLQISLAYFVTMAVLVLITPFLDFFINRFWHLPLTFQFNEKQLRLSLTGKSGGLRLKWSQIHKMEENQRVIILFYGTGNKYIILPKLAFEASELTERRFRDLLAREMVKKQAKDKKDEQEDQEEDLLSEE